MAIAQPVFIVVTAAQDATVTVRLTEPADVSAWTVRATVRSYHGQTALVTKNTADITISDSGNGEWVIPYTASNLTLTPGGHVFEFWRTNSGYEYPICDASPFIVKSGAATTTPTLTNAGEFLASRGEPMDLLEDESEAWRLVLDLGAAEAAVRRHTGRTLTYASYTEYHDGNGRPFFCVKEPPITSITSLYLDIDGYYGQGDSAFSSDDLLTSGTDYYFAIDKPDGLGHAGKVHRVGTAWPGRRRRSPEVIGYGLEQQPGCIKITYIGGYQLVPFDLKRAVWETATMMREASQHGRPFNSESFEDYSYSLGSLADDAIRVGSVANILANYRHGRLFVA